MDRIGTVAKWQWRAYWRRFGRGGNLSAGNQGIAFIVAGLISIKYAQKLRVAAAELAQGRTLWLEALLAGILVVWVLAFVSRKQNGDGWRRVVSLPLSIKELFAVRLASLMTTPYAWMVLAGSVAIGYPISKAPRPFAGMIAALAFTAFAVSMGVTVSHLLSLAGWRRLFGITGFVFAIAVSVYVLKTPWPPPVVSVSSVPPMNLVARAATAASWWTAVASIAMLGLLMMLGLVASFFSFRATLPESSANSVRKLAWGFGFPGRLCGLVTKDLRHSRRLLDIYLGLLAAVVGCIYLVTVNLASLEISIIFLTMIFLPNSPLAFDSFGLDSATGLDRYKLLPLTGRAIVLSKNLAFAVFTAIQVGPVLVLACWRLGITSGLIALITSASLACGYMTWGNWMSLSHPIKMHFFRFSSSSASIFDAMAGIVFSSSPGILIIFFLHNSVLGVALVPIVFGVMYVGSLLLAGRRFPRKLENIARALS